VLSTEALIHLLAEKLQSPWSREQSSVSTASTFDYYNNMSTSRIILGIHDLNPWGGQERSNLEIFYRLSENYSIELHAYSFFDSRSWSNLTYIPYSKAWSKPSLLKFNHYALLSQLHLGKNIFASHRKNENILLQSTGTALPVADVIQVQFIHHAWHDIESQLSDGSTKTGLINTIYNPLLTSYNLLSEKLIYTPAKKYIAISHSIKKELMTYFSLPAESIEVIYHGVDSQQFQPYSDSPTGLEKRIELRQSIGLQENDFVLLTVGALNKRKGVHRILETLSELTRNGVTNISLLAVGAGDVEPLKKEAKKMGIDAKIYFIDAQKDILPYYWCADLFFFPTQYEPFGLVILEAMACGLPVMASTCAGAMELVTHGHDGWYIKEGASSKDLASDIATLMKNKELLKTLASRARETALLQTWETVAKNYSDFYLKNF
jgi:glycosyltransferase involved in cell wall biosynthesis